MRAAAIFVVALAAATPAVAADVRLDGLIAFKDPRMCAPGPDLQQLLDSLLTPRQVGREATYVLGKPEVPPRYRRHVGVARIVEAPDNVYTASLPIRGTWRGLAVREIYTYAQPDTDNAGLGVRFGASQARVRDAANRAGFRLPRDGRRLESSELDLVVQVQPAEGGATLSCGT